ncbi:MAG: hypothetical protein HS115_02915 [Spirochaetales bacterium]|nr:hypothetical protein [Spirochaetales bacterium]
MVAKSLPVFLAFFAFFCEDRFVSTASHPLLAAAETIDRAGDLKQAKDLLLRASKDEALAVEAGKYLEQIDQRRAKADDCIRDLNVAIKSNIWPNRANKLHFQLAVCQELKGDEEAAMRSYDRSIELRSTLPVAFVRRGLLKEAQGDREGALQDLKAGSADYLPGRLILGLFYWRHGTIELARAEARYLLERRPEYARLLTGIIEEKL